MPSQIVAGNWEKRGTIYSQNDDELFRDAIAVIGAPEAGDGLVMEYFDSRGQLPPPLRGVFDR